MPLHQAAGLRDCRSSSAWAAAAARRHAWRPLPGGRSWWPRRQSVETKEVIGGFFILEAKDKAAVVEMTRRFIELHQQILGKNFQLECEVRQLDS